MKIKMKKKTFLWSALLFVSLTAACMEEEVLIDDEVATSEQALNSNAFVSQQPFGTVEVLVQGVSYTGVLVTPRLVLTSNSLVNTNTNPASVSIRWNNNHHPVETRVAKHIDTSAYFPGALIQIAPINDRTMVSISTRSNNSLATNRELLHCVDYVNGRARYTNQYVGSNPGINTFRISPDSFSQALNAADLGVPCFDLSEYKLFGFVTSTGAMNTVNAYRAGNMAWWIENMDHLADIRERRASRWDYSVAGPMSFYLRAPSGHRMCMDIPWGSPNQGVGINQYNCHSGRNQQFYLDYSVDRNNPQIVSASSGLCLDIPGNSSASGVRIQQYKCHQGWNQRFNQSLWSNNSVKIRHPYRTNLCLGLQGSASNSSQAVQQETCSGARDQQWGWIWR